MNIIIFRTTLIYILIVIAMRLMGKRQLGELQPSELVSTILISNLASISIEQPELPLISSIAPVFLIVAFEVLISAICVNSRKIARVITGSPRVVIKHGVIDQKMLNELRYTTDDLLESLRAKDVFDISNVEYAVVETNGSMSVFKKFCAETPTNSDLDIPSPKFSSLSLPIILDGAIDTDNLKYMKKDNRWLTTQLTKEGCKANEVLFMSCTQNGETVTIKKENGNTVLKKGAI